MKKNPTFVLLFEIASVLACIIFPFLVFINAGGWFFPTGSSIYSDLDLLDCMQSAMVAAIWFAVIIGIALLALIIDCFVIMRDIKGFKVSLVSILTAPASYPIVRTEILQEDKKVRIFHLIASGGVFFSNGLVIAALVYYIIRIAILAGGILY